MWFEPLRETWGPQCDGLFAASNVTDPSIGAVNLLHMGNETYGNMWQKIRSMLAYIYDHYLIDYFYICGDDTYVIPDNLRYSVSMLPSNPDKILYMGRKMGDFPRPRRAYCGGGAGYTLSRGAVRTLVGTLYPTKECHPNWTTPQEDRIEFISAFEAYEYTAWMMLMKETSHDIISRTPISMQNGDTAGEHPCRSTLSSNITTSS